MALQLKVLLLVLVEVALFTGTYGHVQAQVNSVFFLEVTNTTGDDSNINDNQLGDNPFNKIRGKMFLNSWLSDEIGVFTKILYDEGLSARDVGKFRIDGAYFLLDYKPLLKAKVGKIPITVGNFPMRNYLEKNPLIGSPLIYHYKTSIRYNKIGDIDRVLAYRGQRMGVTFLYESCWDNGVEIFGSHSKIEYRFAVTRASVFSPKASTNDGEQYIGRIGVRPTVGLRFGMGYAWAPYLSGGPGDYSDSEGDSGVDNIPPGRTLEDYTGEIVVVDFEYTAGHQRFDF